MKKQILIIPLVLLVSGCTHLSNQNADAHPANTTVEANSYFAHLSSLLSRNNLSVLPKNPDQDVNLIEVEKGAAGVSFGTTVDDVVAVWGNPSGFMIRDIRDDWDMYIGACRFGFLGNELVYVSIHRVTIPDAYFANGINFKSSIEDVLSAFGKPIKATDYNYIFRDGNGYVTKFHFMPDSKNKGTEQLIAIAVSHPDAGK